MSDDLDPVQRLLADYATLCWRLERWRSSPEGQWRIDQWTGAYQALGRWIAVVGREVTQRTSGPPRRDAATPAPENTPGSESETSHGALGRAKGLPLSPPLPEHAFPEIEDVLKAMAEANVRPPRTQNWSRTARQVTAARGVPRTEPKHHPKTIQRYWSKLKLPT